MGSNHWDPKFNTSCTGEFSPWGTKSVIQSLTWAALWNPDSIGSNPFGSKV